MNRVIWILSAAGTMLALASAGLAQSDEASRPALLLVQDKQGDKGKKDDKTPPKKDRFVDVPDAPEETAARFVPNMMGDWPGLASFVTVQLPTFVKVRIKNDNGGTDIVILPTTVERNLRVPIASRGSIKIADNEPVLPQDRIFVTYNYFADQRGPSQGSNQPGVLIRPVQVPGQGAQVFPGEVFVPAVNTPGFNVHRQTFGFEKSFLDGAFSFGVRVPLFQQNGDPQYGQQDLGDVTFIGKAAIFRDPATGSGLSAGLAVTAPTGPGIVTPQGTVNDALFQPFVGYQYNVGDLLLFGFSAVVIPTDDRDATILFNDLGIGYRAYQGTGLITALVPAIEAHVTTPLDNRELDAPIRGIDMVILTGGVHVAMGRSVVTLGVATPLTGPRVFNVEAMVQWNWRF